MTSLPFIALGGAVVYTTIRAIWATYIASRWENVCERYMERRLIDLAAPEIKALTDAHPALGAEISAAKADGSIAGIVAISGERHPEIRTLVEYSINAATVWPMHMILTWFWVWDFKRFIVNQDEMDTILAYFRAVAAAQAETVE